MVYTLEEKKKMDNLVDVFAEYTANHAEFDIAYSDKTGYVRLIIDEGADQYFFPLNDFDDLMDMFCMEIVSEEVARQLSKDQFLENRNVDYDSIHLRIQGFVKKLDEAYQKQAAEVVDKHILKRRISPYLL